MQRVMQGAGIAAILVLTACTNTGCSVGGYLIGGAIDGGTKYEPDSVSVTEMIDDRGVKVRSVDIERLGPLPEGPVRGTWHDENPGVEVVTRNGSFIGNTLKIDTVLALKREPEDAGRDGLLPDDSVVVTIRDSSLTRISGRIVHLTERNLVLQVDGSDCGFPFKMLSAIRMKDGRVISGSDLASPQFSGCLIRVPSIVLTQKSRPTSILLRGQESLRTFIPLREAEKIRISRPVVWGPARTTWFEIGAVLDATACVAFIISMSR
jgi:hypothetical protein